MRYSLERQEFKIFYQPKINISTGRIIGVEALLRWQHPSLGLVLPGSFIPIAEETGLIVPIGEWVLRTACFQNKSWQEAGYLPIKIAVNLSARQFYQESFVQSVARILEESKLDPRWLELEITESLAMYKEEYVFNVLRELKKMGLNIALDDFGTGYSSLSHLQRFPIDSLKIDRSFINDLITNPDSQAIVKAAIALAKNLKLNIVAEGVETPEQLDFLRRNKCDEAQGFLFSRPVPASELEAILVQSEPGVNIP